MPTCIKDFVSIILCRQLSPRTAGSVPDGHGTRFYQNGSSYEGAWLEGRRDGYGELSGPRKEGVAREDVPLYAGENFQGLENIIHKSYLSPLQI